MSIILAWSISLLFMTKMLGVLGGKTASWNFGSGPTNHGLCGLYLLCMLLMDFFASNPCIASIPAEAALTSTDITNVFMSFF